jgi:hypothetical protein
VLNRIETVIETYVDHPEMHRLIWNTFTNNVNNALNLKAHRDYVEQNQHGYGDRPYHWLWQLLVQAAPDNFKFLEIGVFQGQTISLVRLIADTLRKPCQVHAVTPLNTTGDIYATHPEMDYLERIKKIHRDFNLASPILYKGYSFDPRIQHIVRENGPFDVVYIDGCHDYLVVVDDIDKYAPMTKPGGYLVIDDAGNDLKLPTGMIPLDFFGLEEVTRAVREKLDARHSQSAHALGFKHVFSVGHNRVFRRNA